MRKFTILACFALVAGMVSCAKVSDEKNPTLSDEALYSTFQDPGNEWRGKPFWSWNGRLEKDELLRQLGVFKEMGMGGAFLHSRVGLQTEYLGEEWFDLTNACVDEAARLGMEAFLYDEDRWPSGTAGGEVTRDTPEYRMNFVKLYTMPANEFNWDSDSIVAAFACDLDGIDYSNLQRLDKNSSMADYKGKTVLKFLHQTSRCSDGYNQGTYVDVFRPDATQKYIELTHDKYLQHCGDRIGTTIQGIFTDEPHRGGLFTAFGGGSDGVSSGVTSAPWTPKMAEEYNKMFGGDLVADLPKLFLRENGERVNDVKWKYCELTQSLFLKNFAKPQYDWCTDHNMIYTGHVLHENNFTCQVTMQGSLMRYYEYMHNPGIDMLTEFDRAYWVPKQLSSVGRQLGKKWLLSELYGCTGWQFDFEDHKAVGDWQALFGINVRCHHLSWYTMEGEAKRDYPASIFFQSAWWKDYKYVEDYYSRLGVMLNQGDPVCDVLVVSPIESVWSQVCIESFNFLSANTPEIKNMEQKYADLFHWLAGERIDFDYGDEEMMSRLSSVDKAEDGTPVLKLGQATYRTALVGNMETMRKSTLDLLEKFQKAGGKVIFMGEVPKYIDVKPSDAPAKLAANCVQVDYSEAAIVPAVKAAIRPVVQVVDKNTGKSIPEIFGQVREDANRYYVVLMSMDREKTFENVDVILPFAGEVALWDCKTAGVWKQPVTAAEGASIVATSFAPIEEKVYTISKKMPAFAKAQPALKEVKRTDLPASYAYKLDEPNICVLDLATWQIQGQPVQPLTEILKIDQGIRKHYGLPYRGGEMLQPWYAEKYLASNSEKLGTVTMNFPFDVDAVPSGDLFLCLETPERYTIKVNGTELKQENNGWYIDPCIRKIAVPASALVKGTNDVELTCEFSRDLNLEAMLLTGDFGVKLDGIKRTLTTLPAQLKVGDVVSQYLPFYSGMITYQIGNLPVPAQGEQVWLEVPGYDGACMTVGDGTQKQVAAWAPYKLNVTEAAAAGKPADVTVVLTRRNTFGPLHALPAKVGAYGPGNWTTEGAGFTMTSYALLPAGMTHQPVAVVDQVL